MALGKDPRETHRKISLVKSYIRIAGSGYLLGIASSGQTITSALIVFSIAFIIAEILGIVEER